MNKDIKKTFNDCKNEYIKEDKVISCEEIDRVNINILNDTDYKIINKEFVNGLNIITLKDNKGIDVIRLHFRDSHDLKRNFKNKIIDMFVIFVEIMSDKRRIDELNDIEIKMQMKS